MSKHTSGPWELIPNGGCTEPDQNYWRIVADPNGSGLFIQGFISESEARLIASGPKLLEALRELSHAIYKVADFDESTRVGAALRLAEAAIAKVEERAEE